MIIGLRARKSFDEVRARELVNNSENFFSIKGYLVTSEVVINVSLIDYRILHIEGKTS